MFAISVGKPDKPDGGKGKGRDGRENTKKAERVPMKTTEPKPLPERKTRRPLPEPEVVNETTR